MTPQRFLAFLLLAVQAAALAVQSGTVVFPAAIAVAALVGAFGRYRVRLTSDQALRAGAVLALVFYAKYLLAPHSVPAERLFIRTQLALAIGQYLLVMQLAQLFLARSGGGREPVVSRDDSGPADGHMARHPGADERLTSLLPGLGVVAMICFAAVRVSDHERLIYQVLVVSFVLFAGLYFGASRRIAASNQHERSLGRALASGAALIAVAAVAWSSAESLAEYERSIEQFISELFSPSYRQTGFTIDGTLGSVTRNRDVGRDDVALLIVADEQPGYLRGQTFDSFRRSYWQSTPARRAVGWAPRPPSAIADRAGALNVFQLRPALAEPPRVAEIWPADSLHERLFHSARTTYIAAAADLLTVDPNGNIQPQGTEAAGPYVVFESGSAADSPDAEYRESLRVIPDEWTGEAPDEAGAIARELAHRLFAECCSTREKVAAVERHFHGNYEYSEDANVPHGEVPLAWFLRERPAAYCEYFATAAALLLREAGVPTRYVTGFMAAERHRFGDYWVARNKDAHAWVEAWDDERGWVIVEATPPAGVPVAAPPSAAVQLWEYLRNGLHQFRTKLAQDGLSAAAPALLAFVTSLPGMLLLPALAAWIAWRWPRGRRRSRAAPRDPQQRSLHRLLSRMDRRLRRCGWERAAGETLHQFAERLLDSPEPGAEVAAVADWYLRYADARYGSRGVDEARARIAGLTALPRITRRAAATPLPAKGRAG